MPVATQRCRPTVCHLHPVDRVPKRAAQPKSFHLRAPDPSHAIASSSWWRFTEPLPLQRSISQVAANQRLAPAAREFVSAIETVCARRIVRAQNKRSNLTPCEKLEAPPGFEPGMEVLQISLGCGSCWLALSSGTGRWLVFRSVWTLTVSNLSRRFSPAGATALRRRSALKLSMPTSPQRAEAKD
jgi:hypothetical protein